jgi:hypothetical protein
MIELIIDGRIYMVSERKGIYSHRYLSSDTLEDLEEKIRRCNKSVNKRIII